MTVEELKALSLPIEANETTALYVGAAIDWLIANTTLEISKETLPESVAALPDGAKLFICRYYEVMETNGNVTSESIGGMSQSFGTSDKTTQLWQLASELIQPHLKSQLRSIGNVSKWV
jgi:hypothetical protein